MGGNTVTRTDQLGRLIALSAKAIELTQEGQRDPVKIAELLDILQAFKEDKELYPAQHCCNNHCKYPHFNVPNRPNFGPMQIRCMCQIRVGMLIHENRSLKNIGTLYCVTSLPFSKEESWWIKVHSVENGDYDSILSLADHNVVSSSIYTSGWNESNWIGFVEKQPSNHNCHHCCHCHS